MKKLLSGIFVAALSSSAMAAINFSYGSVWFFPRLDPYGSGYNWTGQGQSLGVNWDLENDLILGAYAESTDINDGFGSTYPFQVQAIAVSKGVVKGASVGLRLGTFYEAYNAATGMLTDVLANVTLLSGSSDRVSGSLGASFGARFADNNWWGGERWNGYLVGVNVSLGI